MKPLKITVLDIDEDDGIIQYLIELSNEDCSSSLAFYAMEDAFQDFAQDLQDFPQSIHHRVTWQIGQKGTREASFLKLEAYCYEVNGHAALHVECINNSSPSWYHSSIFDIIAEPASLNRLGKTSKIGTHWPSRSLTGPTDMPVNQWVHQSD